MSQKDNAAITLETLLTCQLNSKRLLKPLQYPVPYRSEKTNSAIARSLLSLLDYGKET